MPVDFHKEMDKYLANKRRKRLFSDIKSKVMNKKATFSYKAIGKFGELKEKLTSKVEGIKKKEEERKIKDFPFGETPKPSSEARGTSKSGDFEEPKKEVTQEQVNELLEKKGIKIEPKERIELLHKVEEEGWKEIKIPSLEEKKQDMVNLEEEKKKLQENLFRMQEKERAENERLARLIEEKKQRIEAESEEDRLKRIELEEEIRVLKEKERIEEERLAELRKARRKEQMEALRSRVTDILFKKKPRIMKDMAEEVRKEIRREVKIKEAEKQKAEAKELKQVEEKPEIKDLEKPKEEVTKIEEKLKEKEEVKKIEEKEQKKSFFSNFIQIRTGEEIAKEEEERLKQEEEQALRDQLEINKIFQQGEEEVRVNIPTEEQGINLFTLFPEEQPIQKQMQDSEDVIELDQGYKIKIVKN